MILFFNREFISKNYVSLKEANPNFPILIREASGVEARFFARYGMNNKVLLVFYLFYLIILLIPLLLLITIMLDFGKEEKVVLNNLPAKDVESELEKLVNKSV